jgi:lysozyme family protein
LTTCEIAQRGANDWLELSLPKDIYTLWTYSGAVGKGMPRLVNLGDRASAAQSDELADRAAELLSGLNLRERVPPQDISGSGPSRAGPIPKFENLTAGHLHSFKTCRIRPEYSSIVLGYCQKLSDNRQRYSDLSSRVGVPWYFIGIIHALEASFNFRAHLHNGDYPLTKRTYHQPSGRPKGWLPPSDWEDSAIDALSVDGFTNKSDWTTENILYRFEAFNGLGYYSKGILSQYLWSFSDKCVNGKFTSDGRFDPKAVSKQCGAAVMLKSLVNAGLVTILFQVTRSGRRWYCVYTNPWCIYDYNLHHGL